MQRKNTEPKSCPHCGVIGDYCKWGKTKERRVRYHCNACKKTFTTRTGTMRHRTRLSDKEWKELGKLFALRTCPSGSDIGRYFNKSDKTGQKYLRELRKTLPGPSFGPPLRGIVEIDESMFGNQWVVGAKSRETGDIRMIPVETRDMKTLEKVVNSFLSYNAGAITDEWKGYNLLKHRRSHYTVCHEQGFTNKYFPDIHTNSIEGVWGLSKTPAMHVHRGFLRLDHYLASACFQQNFSFFERNAFIHATIFPYFPNTNT